MIRAAVLALALGAAPALVAAEPLPSGTSFLSEDLRARQADPAANPGLLWVDEGARLWQTPRGAAGKSCASCHGAAEATMRGVAARYPAVDADSGDLLNLEGRITQCQARHQDAAPYPYESDQLLGLTGFVARQSHGMPVRVETGGAAARFHEVGEALFHQRRGQLNLSCAQCHDDNAGRRLRGDTISHGLGNGYPAYRLEWQSVGSLLRRLRSCAFGVRAAPFEAGSPAHLGLELYLASRAEGVAIETPAIRR